eukprot:TRINITY_DN4266_c0_g5_i1.p1 TRINITY_DN4266_c0_g5~~TRINITY_DN4266_c0_g5_i1.p1  ORF type:complete len:903 (-),score=213.18 TRINITY_DN4266_c0_g5_i1:79-2403(-)
MPGATSEDVVPQLEVERFEGPSRGKGKGRSQASEESTLDDTLSLGKVRKLARRDQRMKHFPERPLRRLEEVPTERTRQSVNYDEAAVSDVEEEAGETFTDEPVDRARIGGISVSEEEDSPIRASVPPRRKSRRKPTKPQPQVAGASKQSRHRSSRLVRMDGSRRRHHVDGSRMADDRAEAEAAATTTVRHVQASASRSQQARTSQSHVSRRAHVDAGTYAGLFQALSPWAAVEHDAAEKKKRRGATAHPSALVVGFLVVALVIGLLVRCCPRCFPNFAFSSGSGEPKKAILQRRKSVGTSMKDEGRGISSTVASYLGIGASHAVGSGGTKSRQPVEQANEEIAAEVADGDDEHDNPEDEEWVVPRETNSWPVHAAPSSTSEDDPRRQAAKAERQRREAKLAILTREAEAKRGRGRGRTPNSAIRGQAAIVLQRNFRGYLARRRLALRGGRCLTRRMPQERQRLVLVIEVQSAAGLPSNINPSGGGCDPLLEIRACPGGDPAKRRGGGLNAASVHTVCTEAKTQTQSPSWRETLLLEGVANVSDHFLQVILWDYNLMGNTAIGFCTWAVCDAVRDLDYDASREGLPRNRRRLDSWTSCVPSVSTLRVACTLAVSYVELHAYALRIESGGRLPKTEFLRSAEGLIEARLVKRDPRQEDSPGVVWSGRTGLAALNMDPKWGQDFRAELPGMPSWYFQLLLIATSRGGGDGSSAEWPICQAIMPLKDFVDWSPVSAGGHLRTERLQFEPLPGASWDDVRALKRSFLRVTVGYDLVFMR